MFNISTTSTLILSINSISSVWNDIAISSQDMSCISTASYIRFSKGFRPCKNLFSRNRIIVIAKNIRHIYLTKSRWKQLESNQHLGFLKHLKKYRWPVFLQNRLIIRALPLSYVPMVAVVGVEPTPHGLWGQWLNRLSSPHYNSFYRTITAYMFWIASLGS